MTDHSKLRSLAEAALPGEWLYSETRGVVDTSQRAKDGTLYDGVSWQPEQCDAKTHAQGRYIAAASPSTVIGLLDENERLRTDVDLLQRARLVDAGKLAAMTAARDEACDLADEINGDPASCSYVVPVGERIAELRKVGGAL